MKQALLMEKLVSACRSQSYLNAITGLMTVAVRLSQKAGISSAEIKAAFAGIVDVLEKDEKPKSARAQDAA
jgi:hypothetical protein